MKFRRFLPFAIIISIIIFLKFNEVSTHISKEDENYILSFMENRIPPVIRIDNFNSEIKIISSIQAAVLSIPNKRVGIPKGKSREFKDLLTLKQGECYDLSRSIEQCLRYYGFHVRHVMIFQIVYSKNHFLNFPHISTTHQTTEVLTKKGWLIVDNIREWISLDENGNPVSTEDIVKNRAKIKWLKNVPHPIFESDFFRVIGLYSRHGQFYPPYFPFPNINYSELLQNFRNII